ncbi:MAG TPA: MFS transporter, partial [Verrucomicrobiae bacterium]|nr:MFS transporter [Verrucomicrobiae bacterium]
ICVVAAQLVMGATLLPLTWLSLSEQFEVVRILLILHAFAAATQDVAVDALALRIVPEADRGRLNGGMQAGMLVGRSVFGGGALVLSVHLGWPVIIWALVGCVWLSTIAVLFLRNLDELHREASLPNRIGDFRAILRRRSVWAGLLFAGTAGAAYETAGVLCGPMLVDRGVPAGSVGWLFGVPVVGATIVGGLIGGWFADRFGRVRMIIAGMTGFAAMVLILAALNSLPTASRIPFFLVLTGLYFCIGLFTVASYALFMELSRPPLAATQFSAFMAATNGCEAWASWLGGLIVSRLDYGAAFVVMSFVSLAVLPLLKWIKPDTGPSDPPTIVSPPVPGR